MTIGESAANAVKFDDRGLVAAIVLDDGTGDVLMMAYMNRESLIETFESGTMTYWSRSRRKLWKKGETSGNVQKPVSVKIDCDGDVLLFRVRMDGRGAACHKGYRSCFFRELKEGRWEVCGERLFDPGDVYGR